MLPDHERARRIGEFYVDPRTRTFAKLLIDLEESPHSRAVDLGMLREEELRSFRRDHTLGFGDPVERTKTVSSGPGIDRSPFRLSKAQRDPGQAVRDPGYTRSEDPASTTGADTAALSTRRLVDRVVLRRGRGVNRNRSEDTARHRQEHGSFLVRNTSDRPVQRSGRRVNHLSGSREGSRAPRSLGWGPCGTTDLPLGTKVSWSPSGLHGRDREDHVGS